MQTGRFNVTLQSVLLVKSNAQTSVGKLRVQLRKAGYPSSIHSARDFRIAEETLDLYPDTQVIYILTEPWFSRYEYQQGCMLLANAMAKMLNAPLLAYPARDLSFVDQIFIGRGLKRLVVGTLVDAVRRSNLQFDADRHSTR